MIRNIQAFDIKTAVSVFALPSHPILAKLARLISMTADGWLYLLIPAVVGLLKPTLVEDVIYLLIWGFGLERALYFTLKNTVKRRRPPEAINGFRAIIIASDQFSLPSGHTSGAFFIATFSVMFFGTFFWPLYLWAACVGMSRVVLGVHFPTDILMGALLGSSIAIFIL